MQPASAHRQALPRTVTRFVLEAEEHGHGRGRFQVSGSGKRAGWLAAYVRAAVVVALHHVSVVIGCVCRPCLFFLCLSRESFFYLCFVILFVFCHSRQIMLLAVPLLVAGPLVFAFAGLPLLVYYRRLFFCVLFVNSSKRALFARTLIVL